MQIFQIYFQNCLNLKAHTIFLFRPTQSISFIKHIILSINTAKLKFDSTDTFSTGFSIEMK